MRITGDPERDAEMHYREWEKELAKLPKCVECGEPIQDEYLIVDDDGNCWDEECFLSTHRVWIESFLKGGY